MPNLTAIIATITDLTAWKQLSNIIHGVHIQEGAVWHVTAKVPDIEAIRNLPYVINVNITYS
jgi:hypothetical protein